MAHETSSDIAPGGDDRTVGDHHEGRGRKTLPRALCGRELGGVEACLLGVRIAHPAIAGKAIAHGLPETRCWRRENGAEAQDENGHPSHQLTLVSHHMPPRLLVL